MKRNRILNKALILILVQLLFCNNVSAQTEAEDFNIDSTLYNYYQRCKESLNNYVVLSMCDTLFEMSKLKSDQRMQAVALSTKLDYYYYKAVDDKVLEYAQLVMKFAKETQQPKYYYFAWGKRLIQYYIIQGKTSLALYEAEKMLREAKKDNNKIGIITCYNSLGIIYTARLQNDRAHQYRMEEAALIEKYNVKDYNRSMLYQNISSHLSSTGKTKEAREWLRKAELSTNSVTQKFHVKNEYIHYYLKENKVDSATIYLNDIRDMIKNDKKLISAIRHLYATEIVYYKQTKQYTKALESLEKQEVEENKRNELALKNRRTLNRAEIYWLMDRKDIAANYLMEYIRTDDSIKIANEDKSAIEFATLLNVEKLNNENNELTLKSQEQKIQTRTILIVLLIIILVTSTLFLYREHILNKKLKYSGEQLRVAKERAEDASRMKTIFIQNMSHEIRTPLNSIVGFSKVLTNLVGDNEDAKEYSSIIETNSNSLLKLINDVLDISNLESREDQLSVEETDIDSCCQYNLDIAKSFLKPGVILKYSPGENKTILTNSKKLSQVIENLLHNAAKFTKDGSITLAYSVSKTEVVFTVSDTGIGIPADKYETIFERFVKLDEFSQGTGLGLTICKIITHKMNGEIFIDKNYTEGARFVLTLPIV